MKGLRAMNNNNNNYSKYDYPHVECSTIGDIPFTIRVVDYCGDDDFNGGEGVTLVVCRGHIKIRVMVSDSVVAQHILANALIAPGVKILGGGGGGLVSVSVVSGRDGSKLNNAANAVEQTIICRLNEQISRARRQTIEEGFRSHWEAGCIALNIKRGDGRNQKAGELMSRLASPISESSVSKTMTDSIAQSVVDRESTFRVEVLKPIMDNDHESWQLLRMLDGAIAIERSRLSSAWMFALGKLAQAGLVEVLDDDVCIAIKGQRLCKDDRLKRMYTA